MSSSADHVKKSCKCFHKDVVYKAAVKAAVAQEDMIKCMFENPRFGNLQAEEQEYFIGSIMDSIKDQDQVSTDPAPVLNRSNFYNEERSSKAGFAAEIVEENREKAAVKGKCIPRKLSSSAASKQRKQIIARPYNMYVRTKL
ncbi:hypothetical protein D8674_013279 [Pyrus ussuriensis x Pyrus communis]|uniref:Uncharacterized protein n=1 Tax=Pyrus ussuriensis x Pyrus communis TaxID=2448454 RepID=A0A5N5GW87_9ROSA|nr:hypothetical protein D8674_013279 [Pyrus ussuriensis x Pyrus communis]